MPALGQLRPPKKTSRGAPIIRKQNGRNGFTQNTIFIRFCISCIRAIFDERTWTWRIRVLATLQGCRDFYYSRNINFPANFSTDGYVFTQNTIAFDFASTHPSLKSRQDSLKYSVTSEWHFKNIKFFIKQHQIQCKNIKLKFNHFSF